MRWTWETDLETDPLLAELGRVEEAGVVTGLVAEGAGDVAGVVEGVVPGVVEPAALVSAPVEDGPADELKQLVSARGDMRTGYSKWYE